MKDKFIIWFEKIDKDDIGLVGGKGANLGEMASFGVPVPPGFVITAQAYFYFLKENNLEEKIRLILKTLDKNNPQSYAEISAKIKKLIISAKMPKDLGLAIMKAYLKLGGRLKHAYVAVRSSATAEDLPDASFAGQQETFLNIEGEANVVAKAKACFASLFEPRAIFYREEKGFDHMKVGLAVPVQKMVQSDISGVMFTIDPVSNDKNITVVEATYGLGELIVQGSVTPDHFEVNKKELKIVNKIIGAQAIEMIKVGKKTIKKPVSVRRRGKQKITDQQVIELVKWGNKIHRHYFFPQDIEWAIEKGKIYIVQSRPVTTIKKIQTKSEIEKESAQFKDPPILTGTPASPGMADGRVKIIKSARELRKIKKGDILVTKMTSPDFVTAMKKVAAIVTDKGGQTSHAAIVSRELGVPCIVGTFKATKVLKKNQIITVNGTKGEVYKGGMRVGSGKRVGKWEAGSEKIETNLTSRFSSSPSIKTATKIYVNLAEPSLAAKIGQKHVDGIGLLRAEFMMAEIGQHPRKIIKERKQKMFIEKMVKNLGTFCEQFPSKPVVYRATDFKTNEYKSLVGGSQFEEDEANPMLGFRGARRYIADSEVFQMELEAIKKVRNKLGFRNLWLMVPFVRTPEEMREVKKIIGAGGLVRSPSFKLWMMVEVPSNVILLEDFIKVGIDGVSIGSNDLTMLLLGTDRDNERLVDVFDEENKAVLWAIERVIKICHKHKITSSICGQAPSSSPSLIKKLVEWGVTSISFNPDAIEKGRKIVYKAERELIAKK